MEYSGKQSGYTLIELLLYVVIVGSLLTATSLFFSAATSARIKSQSVSEVEQQGTFAMQYMARTIRNASAVTAPAIGASANQLTTTVPTANLSPTIFSLSGTTLQVKEGAAAAVPLTSGDVQVTSLTFKNLSRSATAEVVQISMTLIRTNTAGRNEYDYSKTFTTSAAVRP
jgi:Tfp pilus assembly protein PilW